MNGRLLLGLCTTVEVVCITALGAIGLKRNNDAYKAELKAIQAQHKLFETMVDNMIKNTQIEVLEKELKELKEKYEGKESD